jgi:transcription termination/antitermination protein NusA
LSRIIYNEAILKYISIFETLTGAKVKDCIVDEQILFVVEKGNMGLAIGKGGQNLKRVQNVLNKTIRVIEFDEDIEQFIKNYSYPLRELIVQKENKIIKIRGKDTKTKGLLIGREKTNLKRMINIINRYFDIDDVIVT